MTRPKAKPSPEFPAVFFPEAEENPFLVKYKTTLCKKLTLTTMAGLFNQVDLAFYLAALGRRHEAVAVADFIGSSVEFSGNYNVWTPVAYALCASTRLHRELGDKKASGTAWKRHLEHPAIRVLEEDGAESMLHTAERDIAPAFGEKSARSACQRLARCLYKFCYFAEMARKGQPYAKYSFAGEAETLWKDGMDKLGQRLTG